MLHTSFKNYDEFKELFVAENADGSTRRKNGILLSFYKSKEMRKKFGIPGIFHITSMADMFNYLDTLIREEGDIEVNARYRRAEIDFRGSINLFDWWYRSDNYETDGHNGICVDGDVRAYRYKNIKRDYQVFKMKVGKMYCHLTEMSAFGRSIPAPVRRWMEEEVTRKWEAYCASRIPSDIVLHVDDDFEGIYGFTGRCEGNFHSCMSNNGSYGNGKNWKFYKQAVKAKAAYLTRGEMGPIVARCILFTEVKREDTGETIRVAERQYSSGSDELLQRLLVQKLISEGYIDAYKKPGAGCGDADAFVDNEGHSLRDVTLSIECHLNEGDNLSYQDSFKWYYPNDGDKAYNHYMCSEYECLETTNAYYHSEHGNEEEDEHDGQVWSDYHDEYINEDDASYVESRNDYFYNDEVVYARVGNSDGNDYHNEYCYEDDCIYTGGAYYYAGTDADYPEDYGLVECGHCESYSFIGDAFYSELTEKWYCCEDCLEREEKEYKEENWYYSELLDEYYETEEEKEEAETDYKDTYWYFSEYDNTYYEDDEEITEWLSAFDKRFNEFERETISYESLNYLIENGAAVRDEATGIYYSVKALDEAISA